MERSLAESRKHINSYAGGGYGGSSHAARGSSRRDELDDYAKELEYIQKRSRAAQRAIDEGNGNYGGYDGYGNNEDPYAAGYANSNRSTRTTRGKVKRESEKVQAVEKVNSPNADR